MARLIKLIVVKILPDYHAMLLKGFQTIILWSFEDTCHCVLWDKILMTFL